MIKWLKLIFNHKYMTNYLQMTQKELNINTVMDKLIKQITLINE